MHFPLTAVTVAKSSVSPSREAQTPQRWTEDAAVNWNENCPRKTRSGSERNLEAGCTAKAFSPGTWLRHRSLDRISIRNTDFQSPKGLINPTVSITGQGIETENAKCSASSHTGRSRMLQKRGWGRGEARKREKKKTDLQNLRSQNFPLKCSVKRAKVKRLD